MTDPPISDRPGATAFYAVLRDVTDLAPNVRGFRFALGGIDRFDFTPGQCVTLHVPLPGAGDEHKRSYSIASHPGASSPDGKPEIELAVTRVEGGSVSQWLHALAPGARVPGHGPYGFFTLDRPPNADLCFVATGTGVAPIRPMLRRVFEAGHARDVTLVFGCRHEEDLIWRGEFEALAARFSNFRFWPTLSRPRDGWPGRRGHVQDHVDAEFGARAATGTEFYLCGLSRMVEDVAARLKAAGWDRKKIHREVYD